MGERRVLTDEMRQQLAGYLPFSANEKIEYTPAFFLRKKEVWSEEKKQFETTDEYLIPDGFRPVFTIRSFTKAEYDDAAKIMHREVLDADNKKMLDTAADTKELVRNVVLGWKDFVDIGTLQEIPFKADANSGVDKDLWVSTRMPDWVYSDIRNYVYRLSGITPGERISLK
jgi:hypothetical protein